MDTDLLECFDGRCLLLSDRETGLRAAIVIDDLTLGPAAGGIRTRAYPSLASAVDEAAGLARAMTIKNALAGLDAGGGKGVVLAPPAGVSVEARARLFERLGERVEELGGLFRTAGDLGTTAADLAAMARRTRYVHTDESGLAAAVARGLLRCVEAVCAARGRSPAGARVAVQGAGAIGAAVARQLADAGTAVLLADLDEERAARVAREAGAEVARAEDILAADVDILAPCAVGGVLDERTVEAVRAWAVCGAANNIFASRAAEARLRGRDVLIVPDPVASAGAVIAGIGVSVMGLADTAPLIDRLGDTAAAILRASADGALPGDVAIARARERIERARAARR